MPRRSSLITKRVDFRSIEGAATPVAGPLRTEPGLQREADRRSAAAVDPSATWSSRPDPGGLGENVVQGKVEHPSTGVNLPRRITNQNHHLTGKAPFLDDLAYVTKDQAETSVLFELISARYERRSLIITANQPFGEWGKVFPDQAMTVAVVDRLVHHATIFEMNVESYRRRAALERKRGRGRPSIHATTAANA